MGKQQDFVKRSYFEKTVTAWEEMRLKQKSYLE